MSNWQQKNFNLDAPEFVPKFGGPPANNAPQQPNQFQPPQQQQQHPFYGQPPQPGQQFYQQQQYRQSHPQQFPQQYQQFYYQQQQQQPQPFNNLASNPLPPPQHQQQHQSQPGYNQPAGAGNGHSQHSNNLNHSQSDNTNKQINQLTNNLNKLNTSNESPDSNSQINSNSTNTQNKNNETSTAKQPAKPRAEESTPVVSPVSTDAVSAPKVTEPQASKEPVTNSVVVEKSEKPSVATIKEDEEWADDAGDEGVDGEGAEGDDALVEKGVDGEAARVKKKKIVIREFKAKKEPINVIFCGHVDAGKSTIGGQIMFLTGMVDKRTLEKYEREAKEKNRESWYLSWALDTNLEEREKGKTVEVGRAFFETEKKHFIILDAPGHKGFVPNMIGGASQADIAVLVISARRGEFETGFERGGQTREHAMLVKTAGVKYLIVLVNKMDDSTVNWDELRYIEIKDKLTPYLKKCGFQPGKDTYFMPCSGFTGAFIKDPIDEGICPWYRGPCFIEYLDTLPMINRTSNGPLRMPVIDKYKDMGTVVMGKIESGMIKLNDKMVVMPNKIKVEVTNIYCEEDETDSAICGENVKLKLRGIEEEEVSSGCVLCDAKDTCQVAKVFDAQVVILDCPTIICPGFNSIMHLHAATVEVQLKTIIGMVDKKTGEKDLKNRPRFIKQDQIAICRFEILGSIACMEPFKIAPQLGRFTLRCESKTVAVGKVLKVIE